METMLKLTKMEKVLRLCIKLYQYLEEEVSKKKEIVNLKNI
jgi:hypothetical protein